jgi:hypothetical protein
MRKIFTLIFWILLIWSSYHLVRDVLQIYGVHHPLIDLWHRNHLWCAQYCSYITIVPEIFVIIASSIVLWRKRIGILGAIVLISIPFWIVAWLLK